MLVARQRAPAWGCCRLVELLVVDHFAHVRARHRDQGTKYGVVLTKRCPTEKSPEARQNNPRVRGCVCGLEDTLPFQHLGIDPVMVCPWSRSFAIATSTWMHPSLSGGDPVRDLAFLSQPRLFGELNRQQGLQSARRPPSPLPPESSRAQPIAESSDGIIRMGKRQIARHSAIDIHLELLLHLSKQRCPLFATLIYYCHVPSRPRVPRRFEFRVSVSASYYLTICQRESTSSFDLSVEPSSS